MAGIRVSGKWINLGRFSDVNDAVEARREGERKYFPYSPRLGDIGDNPRKIEVVPITQPVRQPIPEPSRPAPAPTPQREPEHVPA